MNKIELAMEKEERKDLQDEMVEDLRSSNKTSQELEEWSRKQAYFFSIDHYQ